MRIILETACRIINKLQKKGFEAYFAGGYVRDYLLDRKFKDIDIATNAKPEEIEKIFTKTFEVGKNFGVIIVRENHHNFELATFRTDLEYSDGRRPSKIVFTTAQEDAKRRDFTINGMFYDLKEEKVIDFVEGQKDLKKKIICFIGNAEQRIKEDHLRILRAVRFKNLLNFSYEEKTKKALIKNKKLLNNISGERIQEELSKILEDKNRADALKDLQKLGLLKVILPELVKTIGIEQPKKYHAEGDVFIHTLLCLDSLGENVKKEIVWAVLLHDIGKSETFTQTDCIHFYNHAKIGAVTAENILKKFKFSKKFIKEVVWLIEQHMTLREIPKMREAKRNRLFLEENFEDLLAVFKADLMGRLPLNLKFYDEVEGLYNKFKKELPNDLEPLLSGEDVMKVLELKPSKKVGEILRLVEDKQLSLEIDNKKDALKFLKKMKNSI